MTSLTGPDSISHPLCPFALKVATLNSLKYLIRGTVLLLAACDPYTTGLLINNVGEPVIVSMGRESHLVRAGDWTAIDIQAAGRAGEDTLTIRTGCCCYHYEVAAVPRNYPMHQVGGVAALQIEPNLKIYAVPSRMRSAVGSLSLPQYQLPSGDTEAGGETMFPVEYHDKRCPATRTSGLPASGP